jgi:hypothetical protein
VFVLFLGVVSFASILVFVSSFARTGRTGPWTALMQGDLLIPVQGVLRDRDTLFLASDETVKSFQDVCCVNMQISVTV